MSYTVIQYSLTSGQVTEGQKAESKYSIYISWLETRLQMNANVAAECLYHTAF